MAVETDMRLVAEAVETTGDLFMPVKAGRDGLLTAVGREVVVFPIPEHPGVLECTLKYRAHSTIYDYLWHPSQPYHLLLQKDLPISLQSSSKTIKTYPISNHLDEIRSPITACFSNSSLLFTGLGKTLHQIDIETGGNTRVSLVPKKVKCSSKTIISAIDTSNKLVAVGTYSKVTYIISPQEATTVAILEGQYGGLIQCLFDGYRLFTGGRADDTVYAWDLRLPSTPVNVLSYYRDHRTQQRVLFSLNEDDLRIGNSDGSLYTYSASTGALKSCFNAHFDAVNSTQFTPRYPLITSAGQRHLPYSDLPRPLSSIRCWESDSLLGI